MIPQKLLERGSTRLFSSDETELIKPLGWRDSNLMKLDSFVNEKGNSTMVQKRNQSVGVEVNYSSNQKA